jgi:hypothetical protein
MSIVIPDISPTELLARLRGPITDARPAYPETIHLKLEDGRGGEWWLTTHDAYYSPSDPAALRGKTVVGVDLDDRSGNLTLAFSDGTAFKVLPCPQEADDDPANWKVFTPEGVVLVYGPGGSWRFRRGTDPVF